MFGGTIPFVTPGDLESDDPVKRTVTEKGAAEAGTVRAGSTLEALKKAQRASLAELDALCAPPNTAPSAVGL